MYSEHNENVTVPAHDFGIRVSPLLHLPIHLYIFHTNSGPDVISLKVA